MAALQTQFKNNIDPKMVTEFETLQSASGLAMCLIQLFVFVNLLSMAGAALGAKMGGRR